MIHDHKKAIATMMAKRNPQDGTTSMAPMKPEISKEEDGSMDGRHAAAEDVLMAIHEKSAHKLKEALGNFHALHMAQMAKENTSETEDQV